MTGLVQSAVRPAADGDEPAVREICEAYGNLRPWPKRPDFVDHELGAGRVVVAEWNGEVIAFGASFDRSDVVYLADLFVRPGFLGRGVGASMLESIFDRGRVRLTMASGDPRAMPLYVGFGLRPLTPALYLEADATAALRLEAEPDALAPATPEALAEIDAEAAGRARPREHAFLAATPGAEGFLSDGPGWAGAYGWIRTVAIPGPAGAERHAFLGPIGGRTEEALDRVTRALVRRAAEGAATVHLLLLGPHPSLAALLAVGFRLVDRDTLMCSRLDVVDGRRYAPSPELG